MAVVVIGGQASGVGKTSVICALIAAMPERRWTAIKVTQCSHSDGGEKVCDCDLDERSFAISEEIRSGGLIPPKLRVGGAPADTDSARYLAAGAMQSLWARARPGHLTDAMSAINTEIVRAENVIFESNSVMEFLKPDVYALVVSYEVADFKPTARRYLDRADAFLMPRLGPKTERPAWMDEWNDKLESVPQFAIATPQLVSAEFTAFVRDRLR